ncbi:MAG: restriction endonuclease subunit S [Deltaproteobacteria bacterium]|nr:restriction endonuclease subunit S [Deltaproteobacteria bacterium]
MAETAFRVVQYSELERWDVKYFAGRIKSIYPLVSLADFVTEHNEKIRPFESPYETFKILGVNNVDGIFHAYDALGKEIKQPYKKVSTGDFAYNPYRINVGSIGWVPPEHDGAYISPAYVVFSVDSTVVLPEVFWFILKSDFFNQTLRAATAGSVRMNLTYPLLETLKIPIPPLPIQQKIVAHWEAANSKANEDMAASQELAKSTPSLLVSKIGLKALISPHSRRAFVSCWNEIERWGVELAREMSRRPNIEMSPFPVVSLADVIADLQNGWSPKCLTRPAIGDEWGVLKLGAVSFGWFDERQNKALPQNLKPREQYEVKPGDLIISRANIARYVGACALVDNVRPKLMLCDKLFRVVWKEDSPVLPKYLDEILKIPHLRWQIENNLTGASPTMKNISKPALMALRFPLPPLDIQEEIISAIEEKRKEARKLQDDARGSQKQAVLEIEKMILGTRPVEAN